MSADRLARLDDRGLGDALRHLDLAWPEIPDVTDAVLHEIARGSRPRRRHSRMTIVLVAAAVLLALATAAAATRLVLDLGGVSIRPIPSASVALPPSPVPAAVFGKPVSRAVAEQAVGFQLPQPPALGEPDRIWVRDEQVSFEPAGRGLVVTMAWRPRPGLPPIEGTPFGATLMVFDGDTDVAVKLIDAPFRVIPDHRSFWISAPHELQLLVDGRVRSFRVTGTVLLWQNGALAERLETVLPRRTAVALAFG